MKYREKIRAILIHGNGSSKPTDNWFPYLKNELEKLGIRVDAPQFPETELAKSSAWLPFLETDLKADDNTILIGHSSGALAAMRYAQTHQILGSALIGAYYTHLGIETEKMSGYFDLPWNWEEIRKNQEWIIQFTSTNDPWIPISEAHVIRDYLQTEYYETPDQGHFGGDYYKETFPELLEAIQRKIIKERDSAAISSPSV